VYLQVEDRIKGHFITCIIALMILSMAQIDFDMLNNVGKDEADKGKGKPEGHYSITEIRNTLEEMRLVENKDGSFIPAYDRTRITDDINELLGPGRTRRSCPKQESEKYPRM